MDETEKRHVDPWGEGKGQGSSEEGSIEKEVEEAILFQKQPQPIPAWVLPGLQCLQGAQFTGPRQAPTAPPQVFFSRQPPYTKVSQSPDLEL